MKAVEQQFWDDAILNWDSPVAPYLIKESEVAKPTVVSGKPPKQAVPKKEAGKFVAALEAVNKFFGGGAPITYPKYSYAQSAWKNNSKLLQPSHQTRPSRFPIMMKSAKEMIPECSRALSFGCSTGEECFALAEQFPGAEIVGVDLDFCSIQQARRANKSSLISFHDELNGTGTYDLITAFQVFFCLEEPIPKDRHNAILAGLDKCLNPGGVIMIYTSDWPLEDVLTPEKYEPLNVFARVHNKDTRPSPKQYFNGYYRKRFKL